LPFIFYFLAFEFIELPLNRPSSNNSFYLLMILVINKYANYNF